MALTVRDAFANTNIDHCQRAIRKLEISSVIEEKAAVRSDELFAS